jgi:large subunit ribosomal protein L31
MKKEIHPEYGDCEITCACGSVVNTKGVMPKMHLDICSACHPFFTGKQKLIDTAGRIEKFQRRYGKAQNKTKAS